MMRRLGSLILLSTALCVGASASAAPPDGDNEPLDAQTLRALIQSGEIDAADLPALVEAGEIDEAIALAAQSEEGAAAPADAEPQALATPGVSEEGEVTDPAVYGEFIRTIVQAKREAIESKVLDRVLETQVSRMSIISTLFSVISAFALGLLLMPFVLRKRFPDQTARLWKYSALAALLFFVTINLFAGVLSVLRFGQMAAGGITNPQVQIVSATFDVIEQKAEDLAPMGPILIEPTLQAMGPDSEDPLPVMLLDNVAKFNNEITVFKSVANFFKRVNWVFGYLPIVLSLVTVGVFLMGLRPTLESIVQLPIRAASGEQGAARKTMGSTLRTVGRELLVTLSIMVVLMTVMVVAGLFLSEVLGPALEIFIAYLSVAFIYVQIVPDASSGAVLVALGGTILFLVLDLGVVLAAAGLFIGKAHKIFQRRFHDKENLGAHARFWRWGLVSVIYALAFPLLFIHAAEPILEWLTDWQLAGDEPNFASILIAGPVMMVTMFIGALVLVRVHRAILFLAKYKVAKVGTPLTDAAFRSGLTAEHQGVDVDLGGAPIADPRAPGAWPPPASEPAVPVRSGVTEVYPSLGARTPKTNTTRYRSVE